MQIRGVVPGCSRCATTSGSSEGRFLAPGLAEVVVGRGARSAYQGLDLGATVRFGGGTWTMVGVFDAGGSAFDSEVWGDATVLNRVYQRPPNVYQAVTARLRSPDDFEAFKTALKGDPRATAAGGARRRTITRSSRRW